MDVDAHPHLKGELADFTQETGKFQVKIEGIFESSHYLYQYFPDGRDEPIHGHTWKVEVLLAAIGEGLRKDGISFDFLRARKRLDLLIERIEHVLINQLEEFKNVNPTAENIAKWFFRGLKNEVQSEGVIQEIRIHEGPYNVAFYRPSRD